MDEKNPLSKFLSPLISFICRGNEWENETTMNVSGNMHPRFADVLLKLTYVTILLERHVPPKVESNLET